MNKLNPKDLHLLIDEPIYVLNDHIHQQEEEIEGSKVEEPNVELAKPETTKEIIVITGSSISPEDEEFLFKGLNALDITKDNVSILNSLTPSQDGVQSPHKKEIRFSENSDEQNIYTIIDNSGVSQLQCHTLSNIRSDQDLKVKFWLGLKAMFGK